MKHAIRMGRLSAVLLLAGLAGSATAASSPAPTETAAPRSEPIPSDSADADSPGPMREPEYMARMEAAFDKQDINADGYLTRGPLLQEATAEQIAAMDANGDGRIGKAEFLAYALQNFRDRPKFEQSHQLKR